MSDKEGQDLWYELKGVIEHKGPSVSSDVHDRSPHARFDIVSDSQAHHGHFVARVYDTESVIHSGDMEPAASDQNLHT